MTDQTSPTPARTAPGDRPATPALGRLALVAGAACAALCSPFVSSWESGGKERLVAYHGKYDPPGVWTICDGDTLSVRAGMRETPAGCRLRLDRRLADHAQPVLAATPGLAGHPEQLAAAVSLAYNIGTNAYARSTVARRFNAHDWKGACDGFLAWNKAGKPLRPVAGLTNRRRAERDLCLRKLPA